MVHSVDPFAAFGSCFVAFAGVFRLVGVCRLLLAVVGVGDCARSLAAAVAFHQSNRRVLPLTLVQWVFIMIFILHPFSAADANGRLRIDFLDVGQGDSALITMPDGTTLLVDGGGRPFERETSRSIGEAVVSEYLWWRGLDRVDYVLATHADADHIDGLNDVVRNFAVNSALVGRTPANDPEFAKFSESLNKTNLQTIHAGDVIRFGEVELHVLWPSPGDGFKQ